MQAQRTTTKREKKKAIRKRIGLLLIVFGLFFIIISLFSAKFLLRRSLFISPLSQNQESLFIKLENELKNNKIDYQSVSTNEDLSYLLKLKENGEVVIDPQKNISQQLSSLQLITAQLKIEGKTFRRLDFRFKKPVITF